MRRNRLISVVLIAGSGLVACGPADQHDQDQPTLDQARARRRPDSGVRTSRTDSGVRPRSDSGSGGSRDAGTGRDSGTSPDAGSSGGAIRCSMPAAYNTSNGGSCGVERWAVKTGSDPGASQINLNPQPTTIAALTSMRAPPSPSTRVAPVETTTFILRNVTLVQVKMEADSDYHMVISDGSSTMITEIPFPRCISSSIYSCFATHPRAAVDQRVTPVGSPTRIGMPVTIVGVGFWDRLHNQTGVAPNGVEIHPVLAMCFGTNCDPFAN